MLWVLPFLSASAFAWPPTFGYEWEFLRDEWQEDQGFNYNEDEHRDKLVAKIKEHCNKTKKCSVQGNKVIYPGGYWFEVNTDPGVIEVQGKPVTLREFREVQDRLQRDLFDVARSAKYYPRSNTYGAGHIHIGAREAGFGENPDLLRNFLMDFFNHHELATGVLEWDTNNALSIPENKLEVRKSILAAFEDYDRSAREVFDLKDLVGKIKDAYALDPNGSKYQSINLDHLWIQTPPGAVYDPVRKEWKVRRGKVKMGGTIEIRSIKAQESAEDFARLTELFQARIEKLKNIPALLRAGDWKLEKSKPNMVARFRTYVEETGLDFKDYRHFLPEWLSFYGRGAKSYAEPCSADVVTHFVESVFKKKRQ